MISVVTKKNLYDILVAVLTTSGILGVFRGFMQKFLDKSEVLLVLV